MPSKCRESSTKYTLRETPHGAPTVLFGGGPARCRDAPGEPGSGLLSGSHETTLLHLGSVRRGKSPGWKEALSEVHSEEGCGAEEEIRPGGQ